MSTYFYDYESGELYHYGVKGMKWGVRKQPRHVTKAKNARESAKEWDELSEYEKSRGNTKRADRYKRYAQQDRADAAKYDSVARKTSKAVKEHSKSFNEASRLSDKADRKWAQVKSARKELGVTGIGRTIAALRNKTPEAKRYTKLYDEAVRASDIADVKWSEAKKKYSNTGRNYIERIINNIQYS